METTPAERVKEEANALQEKIFKLQNFIATEAYEKLSKQMREALQEQLYYMRNYFNVLKYRLAIW